MKISHIIIFAILPFMTACNFGKKNKLKDDITVACYYFPNYHPDKRNAEFKGEGWTEWELVKDAVPRFEGHYQPNEPLWGYTDESDPVQMAQKIEAASSHGIDAFIFDWYYYEDGQFLEKGLEEGFMKAENKNDMDFSLMWANHNWNDIHPIKLGEDGNLIRPVLYPAKMTLEGWNKMSDFVIEQYFKDESYWLIDGSPYFSIYQLQDFIDIFGSIEGAIQGIKDFRKKVIAAGFKDLHLNAVIWGRQILSSETVIDNVEELCKELGFSSTTSYVWIHHVRLKDYPETPYKYVQDKYFEYVESAVQKSNLPYYPNVTMGWDASPRCAKDAEFKNYGYPCMSRISENTPEAFKGALIRTKEFLNNSSLENKIFNINCWNEWTEGSYLEPDKVNGFGYLEAIKEVFGENK